MDSLKQGLLTDEVAGGTSTNEIHHVITSPIRTSESNDDDDDDAGYDPVANKKAWSTFKSRNFHQSTQSNNSQPSKPLLSNDVFLNKEYLILAKSLKGKSLIDRIPEIKSLCLCLASYEGNLSWIETMINHKVDVCNYMMASIIEGIYATPIEFASRRGHLDIIFYLFDKHATSLDADSVRRALIHVSSYGCDNHVSNESISLAMIDALLKGGQPHGFTTTETLLKCEAAVIGGIEGWNQNASSNQAGQVASSIRPKTYRTFMSRLKQYGDDCIDESAWAAGVKEAALLGDVQLIATQMRVHGNKLQPSFLNTNSFDSTSGYSSNLKASSLVWMETLNIARDQGDTAIVDLLKRSGRLSLYDLELSEKWSNQAWSIWAASSDTKRIEMTERLSLLTDYPHTLPQALTNWFQSLIFNNFNFLKADIFQTTSRMQELKKLLVLDSGDDMNVSNSLRAGSLLEGHVVDENHDGATSSRPSVQRSSTFQRRMRGCHVDADLRPFYSDLHRRASSKPYRGVATTALERAAEVGDHNAVRLLLLAGARTTGTACFVARYWKHRKVIALLSGPRAKALKSLSPQTSSNSPQSPARMLSNASSGMLSDDGVNLSNQYMVSPSSGRTMSEGSGLRLSFSPENLLGIFSDSPEIEAMRVKEYQKRVGTTSSFFYWRYISRMDWWVVVFIIFVFLFLASVGLVGIMLLPDIGSGKSISL